MLLGAAPAARAGAAAAAAAPPHPPPPPPPPPLRARRRHRHRRPAAAAAPGGAAGTVSESERFSESLLALGEAGDAPAPPADLAAQRAAALAAAAALTAELDALYRSAFSGLALPAEDGEGPLPGGGAPFDASALGEAAFGALGRDAPRVMAALLAAKRRADPGGWAAFQAAAADLKARRGRAEGEAAELAGALRAAEAAARRAAAPSRYEALAAAEGEGGPPGAAAGASASPSGRDPRQQQQADVRIVLLTGFESFNVAAYRAAAVELAAACPAARLLVFSDRDLADEERRAALEAALARADVFFCSLVFDYDQAEWLRPRAAAVPTRLVFESALELMSLTRVGSFSMARPPGAAGAAGPPPAVKKLLAMFGGREEDKMVGYLSMLKVGPKLLKFLPGQKARDIRVWLTAYAYWNQGGAANVASMLAFLVRELFPGAAAAAALPPPPPPAEAPATGCVHPAAPGRFFGSPAEYMAWYEREYAGAPALAAARAPTVAVLLYRKHVLTGQPYINQLIELLEAGGVRPLPVFINGVEAHTIVRDQLTSAAERAALAAGAPPASATLRTDAVVVDAVVNTVGFPLVGGPAGTMEGGRAADVAAAILEAKDVPYVVAAPLLVQDIGSWAADGVAGLQSVVLYALPELDGAVDALPLGGLVGDDIYLVPERVGRLAARLRSWARLRAQPASERRLAVLLYGFPPGVGATGTAALLNVPRSLEALLAALHAEGYDLGGAFDAAALDGEALVAALAAQAEPRAVSRGAAGVDALGAGAAAACGAAPAAAEVSPAELRAWLAFPEGWGPNEWGPLPYLPPADALARRLEGQWGDLDAYRGLMTSAAGNLVVPGLRLGNVWLGVQPALGLEGDPMRLLFERDLTPHPQYAAFYGWLRRGGAAGGAVAGAGTAAAGGRGGAAAADSERRRNVDAVVHFGMHGTVEWLPGAPLGSTALSWPDVLLGEMPNVYIYAANNPSESLVAKRRGFGTIVSHNVPPYGRAGLYAALAELRRALAELLDAGDPASAEAAAARGPALRAAAAAGLGADVPLAGGADLAALAADDAAAAALGAAEFAEWAARARAYLAELEGRLFSEGLHTLGAPPAPAAAGAYLSAYFGAGALPAAAAEAVAAADPAGGLAAARAALERALAAPSAAAAGGGGAGGGGATAAAAAGLDDAALAEAVAIRDLLAANTLELAGVLRALRGGYVPPAPGGDLLRDGPGVLPTGRNIYALDPYRMPSDAAAARGAAAAAAILDAHRAANGGAFPETVAVNLWGLDAIKTRGESVGIALALLGARPLREGTGRVARFELVPLAELGRPRVDVLCNMSGIFRDSFAHVVDLLDDAFQRAAAAADEPDELNFVAKHARALRAAGVANPGARLFSNPAGDYGSMVGERVGAGSWEAPAELGATWASRNAFSYGRGGERGAARPEVLRALLETTERVVQEVDSVEYGLTDIQEYYANTGALVAAARAARGGAPVGCSVVEAFGPAGGPPPAPRELDAVLRLEYRSKLLNPRWAEAMAGQGSGGAYEISSRLTAMVGWGATAGFSEKWAWDQAHATYAGDAAMAARLRASNPQAFANVLRRLLEAAGRGMWEPDAGVLERLRAQFAEMDDALEGVTSDSGSER